MFESVLRGLQPSMQWASQRCDQRGLAGINTLLVVALGVAVVAIVSAWFGGYHGGFLLLNKVADAWIPDWLWESITRLGDVRILVLLSLLFARRRPEVFWAMLVATLLAILYTRGLKPLVDAVRPPGVLGMTQYHLIPPLLGSDSFPSGHSVSIAVFCGVLFIATDDWRERLALMLLMLLVLVSRVAMGVHWPQDVMAGAFGGLLAAALGSWLAYYWRAGLRPVVHLWLVILLPGISVITLLWSNSGNPSTPWLVYPLIFASATRWWLDYGHGRR